MLDVSSLLLSLVLLASLLAQCAGKKKPPPPPPTLKSLKVPKTPRGHSHMETARGLSVISVPKSTKETKKEEGSSGIDGDVVIVPEEKKKDDDKEKSPEEKSKKDASFIDIPNLAAQLEEARRKAAPAAVKEDPTQEEDDAPKKEQLGQSAKSDCRANGTAREGRPEEWKKIRIDTPSKVEASPIKDLEDTTQESEKPKKDKTSTPSVRVIGTPVGEVRSFSAAVQPDMGSKQDDFKSARSTASKGASTS